MMRMTSDEWNQGTLKKNSFGPGHFDTDTAEDLFKGVAASHSDLIKFSVGGNDQGSPVKDDCGPASGFGDLFGSSDNPFVSMADGPEFDDQNFVSAGLYGSGCLAHIGGKQDIAVTFLTSSFSFAYISSISARVAQLLVPHTGKDGKCQYKARFYRDAPEWGYLCVGSNCISLKISQASLQLAIEHHTDNNDLQLLIGGGNDVLGLGTRARKRYINAIIARDFMEQLDADEVEFERENVFRQDDALAVNESQAKSNESSWEYKSIVTMPCPSWLDCSGKDNLINISIDTYMKSRSEPLGDISTVSESSRPQFGMQVISPKRDKAYPLIDITWDDSDTTLTSNADRGTDTLPDKCSRNTSTPPSSNKTFSCGILDKNTAAAPPPPCPAPPPIPCHEEQHSVLDLSQFLSNVSRDDPNEMVKLLMQSLKSKSIRGTSNKEKPTDKPSDKLLSHQSLKSKSIRGISNKEKPTEKPSDKQLSHQSLKSKSIRDISNKEKPTEKPSDKQLSHQLKPAMPGERPQQKLPHTQQTKDSERQTDEQIFRKPNAPMPSVKSSDIKSQQPKQIKPLEKSTDEQSLHQLKPPKDKGRLISSSKQESAKQTSQMPSEKTTTIPSFHSTEKTVTSAEETADIQRHIGEWKSPKLSIASYTEIQLKTSQRTSGNRSQNQPDPGDKKCCNLLDDRKLEKYKTDGYVIPITNSDKSNIHADKALEVVDSRCDSDLTQKQQRDSKSDLKLSSSEVLHQAHFQHSLPKNKPSKTQEIKYHKSCKEDKNDPPVIQVFPADLNFGHIAWGSCQQQYLTIRNLSSSMIRVIIKPDVPSNPFWFSAHEDIHSKLYQPDKDKKDQKIVIYCRAPAKELDKELSKKPPQESKATVQVEALSNKSSSVVVQTVNLRVMLGYAKLYIPADAKVLEFRSLYGQKVEKSIQLKNGGNIDLQVTLLVSRHKEFFSVMPSTITIQPHSLLRVKIIFFSPSTKPEKLECLLLLHHEPDGELYEIPVVGHVLVPSKSDPPLIFSDHSQLPFYGVPVGHKKEKTMGILNKYDHPVTMTAEIRGPDYQIRNDKGELLTRLEELVLPPGQTKEVRLMYIPSAETVQKAKLLLKPKAAPFKLVIPLSGYGGVSQLVVQEAEALPIPNYYKTEVGPVIPDNPIIKTLVLSNKGCRSAHIETAVFSDVNCTKEISAEQVEMSPVSFHLLPSKQQNVTLVLQPSERELTLASARQTVAVLEFTYTDEVNEHGVEKSRGNRLMVALIGSSYPTWALGDRGDVTGLLESFSIQCLTQNMSLMRTICSSEDFSTPDKDLPVDTEPDTDWFPQTGNVSHRDYGQDVTEKIISHRKNLYKK